MTIEVRKKVEDVDHSLDPKKTSSNCLLFVRPEGQNRGGGCTLAGGAFHRSGYCHAWVAAAM